MPAEGDPPGGQTQGRLSHLQVLLEPPFSFETTDFNKSAVSLSYPARAVGVLCVVNPPLPNISLAAFVHSQFNM